MKRGCFSQEAVSAFFQIGIKIRYREYERTDMKKHLSLLFVLILLSGCATPPVKPPPETLKAMRNIAVVPMEPPPLDMSPLIPMDARSVEDMLRTERWIPTVVLAQEAGNQIDSSGLYKAIVADTVYEYPGLRDREPTWHLQNWQKPMRHWYEQEVSPFDYSTFKDQNIDAVVEVSLMYYGIDYALVTGGSLRMVVQIKLVDAANGKVLGRSAERLAAVSTGPLDKFFANNGEGFKKLFNAMAGKIIRKELQYLTMLPGSG